ncbi:sporulation integral membrane protein YtvI [Clostridium sp. SYSU_GA19001]|uniref:sporulation integral membrane protein YtvI n=1 Tax=Clostridium caldaquaticum TaxID=2940653 RepID=UPI0020772D09|nr:sporulation integral membrane protein YtvI [Clostridium caldaquaticum]MCM8711939.1 sporulation integral membrane protein YtvI [Clostridium caldaquaticum]
MNRIIEKLDKLIIFFVIYTLTVLVFFKTLSYTLPFVLAFIFASVLQKPTKFLAKKLRVKNSIAAILTTFFFFALIILIAAIGITSLTNEAIQLGKSTQAYITNNSYLIDKYVVMLKEYYENLDPTIVDAVKTNISTSITKISNITASLIGNIVTGVVGFLTSIPYIIMVIIFTLLSTYFFTRDMTSAKNKMLNILPAQNTHKMINILSEAKKMLSSYALSYAFIICITFLETIIGFSIFKVKYAVILSIIAAIFDVLPVLGVGSVYIPTAIIYLLSGKYFTGGGILILYAIVFIMRQILEPKLVSSSLGLHPVPILAAIFIGLKINGVSGMFFCMFLVVFYNIFKKVDLI